jgi:endo-1,4-beta-xylanase
MQLTRREMIAAGASALAASAAAAGPLFITPYNAPSVSLPSPSGTLRDRAARKGLLVGASVEYPAVNTNQPLRALLAKDCNILVPEDGFNMTRVQPYRGAPLNFSQAHAVYDLAQSSGAKFRYHDVIYDLTTPQWVKDFVPSMSASQAGKFLTDYVTQVVTAWRGKAIHFEVVNEPGYKLGPPYRPFVFAQKLGWDYFDLSYHAAHAADPHAVLFTNAAVLEPVGRIFDIFRAGMLKLLEGALKRGVPIHALGIEGHMRSDYPFDQKTFAKFLDEVTGMGLKIMVTEFDINDRAYSASPATRDQQTAAFGKEFLDVCFHYPQCIGLISWNMADSETWLRKGALDRQRRDHQLLRPTLYDDAYMRKPLWSAVAAAIDGAPVR